MPPAELFPPEAYASGWVVAAVLALAVVVAWPVVVVLITKPKPARAEVPSGPPPADHRGRALAELAEVRRRWRQGSLSARHAHQEISGVVRGYVATAGLPGVETMTLAELRTASEQSPRLTPVADLVEQLYPPEFAAGEDVADRGAHPVHTVTVLRRDPDQAFARAEEVLRGWS